MSSEELTPDESFGKLIEQYQRAVNAQEFEDATGAIHQIFAFAADWCDKNASPELYLTIAAAECEQHADWCGAEASYNQILSLPDVEPLVEYKAHSSLASLCRLLHRDPDALDHARRATAVARRADLPIVLAMALHGEARSLIRCDQITEAGNVIAEAISVIDDDKIYNQINASILTLRADFAIRNGALAKAKRDLEQASAYLEPLAEMEIAAGVHSDLARCWSVTARLHAARGDRNKAIAAWQEAVSSSKHVASLPHAESVYTEVIVAEMLDGLAHALLVCDRVDDAAAAFDESKKILDSAGVPQRDAE